MRIICGQNPAKMKEMQDLSFGGHKAPRLPIDDASRSRIPPSGRPDLMGGGNPDRVSGCCFRERLHHVKNQ